MIAYHLTFTNPALTKCKHYFCEKCALEYYKSCQKCYACRTYTNGVFNPAKEIIAKMEKYQDSDKDEEESDRAPFKNMVHTDND